MELDWGAEIRTASLRGLVQDTGLGPGVGPVSTCSSLLSPTRVAWLCQSSSETGEEKEDTTSHGHQRPVALLAELLWQVFPERLLCSGPVSGTAIFKDEHQNLWLQGVDNRAKGANMNPNSEVIVRRWLFNESIGNGKRGTNSDLKDWIRLWA